METQPNAVEEAISKAGSQVRLAELLGVKQQIISVWLHRKWVPTARAVEIEIQLGIPRARLINPRLRDLIDGEVQNG